MTITPKQIKDFLNKDNDGWYGSILEGILDTYQEDMSIEEIDRLIKEEVQDFKQGYNEFCERN
jgi:hypothetical protein|tara:strand:- start:638 stop:826 length:189 start_codon:yes stop_codon:yes gene_type:complete